MTYTPHTDTDRAMMLKTIGIKSMDDLFSHIPDDLRAGHMPDIPGPLSEEEIATRLAGLAAKNKHTGDHVCFLGMGAYDHHIPSAVDAMAARGEFFTAYTPYQPEMSQGNLQAIFEYQTMMASLTGMEVSNASLYDGATAVYEACLMAMRITRRSGLVICDGVNPLYRESLNTYASNMELDLRTIGHVDGRTDVGRVADAVTKDTAAVVVQYPTAFGVVQDITELAEAAHAGGALLIAVSYPLALGLLKSPGEMGADIACGEAQSLGIPLQFGGPYLGYLTCYQKHVRMLPGRLVGETVDAKDRRGFVLALQTREQHIRRAKATSNICSNQALLALRASIFLTCMGPDGLRELAELNFQMAAYARRELTAIPGCRACFEGVCFNEFVLQLPKPAAVVLEQLREEGIAGGVDLAAWYPDLENSILVSVTDRRTQAEIDRYREVLSRILKA